MALLETYDLNRTRRGAISLIVGIIYATSDEIHQIFIPGRGPLFTDVILDTMGVFLGILLIVLIMKIYEKVINKNKGCIMSK